MRALGLPQIAGDALLQAGLDIAEIMLQQDVFGRDRGVGFELEHPMAVLMLGGGSE